MRRDRPTSPDLLTGVLFDRSGSMCIDERYIHARRALIVLRIVYERLGLPTVVTWFADQVGTVLTSDDSLSDPVAQERLMAETLPRHEGNQDGKGLAYLAEKMREHQAGQRVIIVLTDAGVCDEAGLTKVVTELSHEGTPVLHFGLGHGTADCSGCFKHSWGDLDVLDSGPSGFMSVFCDVIQHVASGAFQGTISDDVS